MKQRVDQQSESTLQLKPLVVGIWLAMGMVSQGVQAADRELNRVAAGSVEMDSSATLIDQQSDTAILEWERFNIVQGDHVQIRQLSEDSVLLNRVQGSDLSQIDGRLSAIGQVIISNPHGVMFGEGAIVDVASLIATTADVNNNEFLTGGEMTFEMTDGQGSVENNGTIVALKEHGLVALVAPSVVNNGLIHARSGSISLAGGQTFTIDLNGDGLISFAGDSLDVGGVLNDGNFSVIQGSGGSIQAPDGRIQITAGRANGYLDGVINLGGEIRATTLGGSGGSITLTAQGDAGSINLGANTQLDASGDTAGGTITLNAQTIDIGDRAILRVEGANNQAQGRGEIELNLADSSFRPRLNIGDQVVFSANSESHEHDGRLTINARDLLVCVTGECGYEADYEGLTGALQISTDDLALFLGEQGQVDVVLNAQADAGRIFFGSLFDIADPDDGPVVDQHDLVLNANGDVSIDDDFRIAGSLTIEAGGDVELGAHQYERLGGADLADGESDWVVQGDGSAVKHWESYLFGMDPGFDPDDVHYASETPVYAAAVKTGYLSQSISRSFIPAGQGLDVTAREGDVLLRSSLYTDSSHIALNSNKLILEPNYSLSEFGYTYQGGQPYDGSLISSEGKGGSTSTGVALTEVRDFIDVVHHLELSSGGGDLEVEGSVLVKYPLSPVELYYYREQGLGALQGVEFRLFHTSAGVPVLEHMTLSLNLSAGSGAFAQGVSTAPAFEFNDSTKEINGGYSGTTLLHLSPFYSESPEFFDFTDVNGIGNYVVEFAGNRQPDFSVEADGGVGFVQGGYLISSSGEATYGPPYTTYPIRDDFSINRYFAQTESSCVGSDPCEYSLAITVAPMEQLTLDLNNVEGGVELLSGVSHLAKIENQTALSFGGRSEAESIRYAGYLSTYHYSQDGAYLQPSIGYTASTNAGFSLSSLKLQSTGFGGVRATDSVVIPATNEPSLIEADIAPEDADKERDDNSDNSDNSDDEVVTSVASSGPAVSTSTKVDISLLERVTLDSQDQDNSAVVVLSDPDPLVIGSPWQPLASAQCAHSGQDAIGSADFGQSSPSRGVAEHPRTSADTCG